MGAATLAMNIPRLGGRTRSPIFPISKVRHDGLRVGPVGSTIISEVFVGLVHGDHNSFPLAGEELETDASVANHPTSR
jgi:predicted small integral membrane protein